MRSSQRPQLELAHLIKTPKAEARSYRAGFSVFVPPCSRCPVRPWLLEPGPHEHVWLILVVVVDRDRGVLMAVLEGRMNGVCTWDVVHLPGEVASIQVGGVDGVVLLGIGRNTIGGTRGK